jgi:hypothetical protein
MALTLFERQTRSARAAPCPQPDNPTLNGDKAFWRNKPEITNSYRGFS